MASPAEDLPTHRRLGYLLKHVHAAVAAANDAALVRFDIDGRDLGVLLVIESSAPASQQELAQRMNIDRTSMVARLDGLEAKGIVTRQADPDDRRRNLVLLTEAGRQLVREATAASDAAESGVLEGLSVAEAEQLRSTLVRLLTHLSLT